MLKKRIFGEFDPDNLCATECDQQLAEQPNKRPRFDFAPIEEAKETEEQD
jgi:hypothetical protein